MANKIFFQHPDIAMQPGGIAQFDHRPDTECWMLASDFLTKLIGSPPDSLWWDFYHHLQGHVCIQGLELVVIASRDTAHEPVVVTAVDWDEIRRASAEERVVLLGKCAIADHNRLEAVLGRNDPVPSAA